MESMVRGIENRNGELVVSSRVVAEQLGKRHSDVLGKIKDVCNEREFSLVEYKDNKGELRPEALLTKDGFILLCMNYNGYNDFKRAYIAEFNRMEKELNNPLAIYENKSRWEIIMLHAQAEQEKELLMIENKEIKQAVVEIKKSLNNLEADVRVNINQAIRRLADTYCKHNKISGIDRECIYREIYQTVYTGFCKEYDIDFQDIKDKEYISLKTGKPCKTKQSFIKIIEKMGYSTMLMEYVIQLKPTEINL